MNNSNIIDVNEIDFEKKVLEESSDRLVVVDFWAPWCGPCKQLTPILEKTISASPDKIVLVKINIDENQQIASQLRIQSIPAVYAFKNKEVVNAFQGIIPETEVIKFLEKSLGDKLGNNFDEFYKEIQNILKQKSFTKAKNLLEEFISENSKEINGICMYLETLIELNELDAVNEFVDSLDDELAQNNDILKIIKRIELIKKTAAGPSVEELFEELRQSPEKLEIIFKISDKYFANNNFDKSFEILLEHYPKNKDQVKIKIISFFDVLGFDHPSTILYRRKFSTIMFS